MLTPQAFKLETRVGAKNQEKIEINFQRILPECGWTLSLKSDNKASGTHFKSIQGLWSHAQISISDIQSWANKPAAERPTVKPCPQFTIRLAHSERVLHSQIKSFLPQSVWRLCYILNQHSSLVHWTWNVPGLDHANRTSQK